MKRALIGLLLGCLMTMGLSTVALAGGDNAQASISLHISSHNAKVNCTNPPSMTNSTMVTEVCGAPGTVYDVWFLVCNGSDSTGIAGMEFGINYNGLESMGLDVSSWLSCGDLEFPQGDGVPGGIADWPEAGSGNIITWDRLLNCQIENSEPLVPNTVIAVGGVMTVVAYGPDQLLITPRPVSGFAKVANCNATEDRLDGLVPSHLGIAGFCMPGYNACALPTPTESTTWGRVKQQYK